MLNAYTFLRLRHPLIESVSKLPFFPSEGEASLKIGGDEGLREARREGNGPKTMKDKSSSPRPSQARCVNSKSRSGPPFGFRPRNGRISFFSRESDIFLRVACQDLIAGFVLSFTI